MLDSPTSVSSPCHAYYLATGTGSLSRATIRERKIRYFAQNCKKKMFLKQFFF